MVYYFTSLVASNVIYMGKDKFENEDLIKYHFPEDVWFHVDKHSSAHVYLRMSEGQAVDTLDPQIVEEMAQITKENSIQGKKEPMVKIIYTLASNLKKTGNMDTGEVGFHNRNIVYSTAVKRNKELLNKLRKTQVEIYPQDLKAVKDERDKKERDTKRKEQQVKTQQEKELIEKKRVEKLEKSYDSMFVDSKKGNKYDVDDVFGEGGEYTGSDFDDFI
ncbi:coiled-coil domain-containing protein [Acrasis kona]|uniref:Coiled-coil domain-containing protein n=1 Tax=Acrasis kona TaxID=1008807 RepID=A0AAW2Z0C1_9EUKA